MPTFTIVALKCVLTAPKIVKIGNFWYIFARKRYIPLSNFYKIWRGEGFPCLHGHANFHHCGFKNVALRCQNKFAPKKKSRGSIEKLEYRCTTRNLPLCNGTIIVLKIKLLHSVSVITNFVILKRDKQTYRQTKKNITLFYLQPASDPRSPQWHGDRGGPSHFCTRLTFFDPISSFTTRGY